jgi:hypothetical protein
LGIFFLDWKKNIIWMGNGADIQTPGKGEKGSVAYDTKE